jgi:transcription initiation factor IIE alpha subunit
MDKKLKRKFLVFANELAEFAARCPDTDAKRAIYGAVNQIRRRYGFSLEEKKQIVLVAIRTGASTREDLIRETGFNKTDVDDILKALVEDRLIRLQSFSTSGTGRPSYFFTCNESNVN